jgi:hypothetical protein
MPTALRLSPKGHTGYVKVLNEKQLIISTCGGNKRLHGYGDPRYHLNQTVRGNGRVKGMERSQPGNVQKAQVVKIIASPRCILQPLPAIPELFHSLGCPRRFYGILLPPLPRTEPGIKPFRPGAVAAISAKNLLLHDRNPPVLLSLTIRRKLLFV